MLSYLILPGLIYSSSLNNIKTETCKQYGLYICYVSAYRWYFVNKKSYLLKNLHISTGQLKTTSKI
jgi:hypothetical protein